MGVPIVAVMEHVETEGKHALLSIYLMALTGIKTRTVAASFRINPN
jgi:hypothetical protein